MTILLTDPTEPVSNAVMNRLESSGRNIIRKAIHAKVKVDKLNLVHEIAKSNYTRRETIADTLNNIDRLSLRSPPLVERVDISSNVVAKPPNRLNVLTGWLKFE